MDKKEYNSIHWWLKNNMIGDECAICGTREKKLDNALKTGFKYEKKTENFIKLCRKCHYNYDHPNGFKHSTESKIKIGIESKKRILRNGVSEKFINSKKGTKITEEHKKIISEKMKGENHHQSKLTEQDIIFIRNSNLKLTELAIKYNVTYENIYNIKKKKTWKHLD